MRFFLQQILCQFLKKHHETGRPLILALSGGDDSFALLHVLHHLKKRFSLQLHVAHVDHSWRPESSLQAATLKAYVEEKLGLVFHLETLESPEKRGNLEALYRQKRLQYFQSLYRKLKAQAFLLAHHADDQAETILKRMFEGTHFINLACMRPVSKYEDVVFWRPFLFVRKTQLQSFLKKQNLVAFSDSTNADVRFLRARMRKSLLPFVNKSFGKEVVPGLSYLAEEASQIKDYLEKQVKGIWKSRHQGVWGDYFDLSKTSVEPVELKFFLRSVFREKGLVIQRDEISQISQAILEGKTNKYFPQRHCHVYVDRRILFFVKNQAVEKKEMQLFLKEGFRVFLYPWRISVRFVSNSLEQTKETICWKDFWKGHVRVSIPDLEEKIFVGVVSPKKGTILYQQLSKKWNQNKLACFFREIFPIVWTNKGKSYDIHSHYQITSPSRSTWELSFDFIDSKKRS